MKKLLLFIIVLSAYSFSNAASFTSAANGEWTTVSTWSPMGIPQPGDDVTINHNVILDDGYTVNGYWSVDAGSITIGVNGSLVQGTNVIGIAIQNGGTITNNGVFSFDQLGNYSGTFTNNGDANLYRLIYNLDIIDNYGNIQEVDSFYTSGTLTCYYGSSVSADSTQNEGVLVNEGDFISNYFYNTNQVTNLLGMSFVDFYNTGNFLNYAAIMVSNDGLNAGNFTIADGAHINLTRNFSNSDDVNHDALFINDGLFNIGDSWTNSDTTKGGSTGEFHIENGTYNSGYMKGTFLFCDNSPTVTVNPIIDNNTGTIEPGITYCLTSSVNDIAELNDVSVYPNPANSFLYVDNIDVTSESLKIFDITGKNIICTYQQVGTSIKIDVSKLNQGIYFVRVSNKTIKFVKEYIK